MCMCVCVCVSLSEAYTQCICISKNHLISRLVSLERHPVMIKYFSFVDELELPHVIYRPCL